MSEALIIRSECNLEEFAERHGLSVQRAADILNDPQSAKILQDTSRARARVAFHGRAIERLINIANGEDDKSAISAITLLGKLAGEFKAPKPVVLSFDELIKRATAVEAGPLGGITQIVDAQLDEENGHSSETIG